MQEQGYAERYGLLGAGLGVAGGSLAAVGGYEAYEGLEGDKVRACNSPEGACCVHAVSRGTQCRCAGRLMMRSVLCWRGRQGASVRKPCEGASPGRLPYMYSTQRVHWH
jgi:hypothetical protein